MSSTSIFGPRTNPWVSVVLRVDNLLRSNLNLFVFTLIICAIIFKNIINFNFYKIYSLDFIKNFLAVDFILLFIIALLTISHRLKIKSDFAILILFGICALLWQVKERLCFN